MDRELVLEKRLRSVTSEAEDLRRELSRARLLHSTVDAVIDVVDDHPEDVTLEMMIDFVVDLVALHEDIGDETYESISDATRPSCLTYRALVASMIVAVEEMP